MLLADGKKRFLPTSQTSNPYTPMKKVFFIASLDDTFERVFDSYASAREFVLMRIGWDLAEFGSARMRQFDDDSDFQVFYACVSLPGGVREYAIHPQVCA